MTAGLPALRRRRAAVFVVLLGLGVIGLDSWAYAGDSGADLGPPAETPHSGVRIVPLPMYTTVPTEGSTYGLMPVLLGVNAAGIVRIIGAPSVSWNSAAGVTGTLRFYWYPSVVRSLSVITSASTHLNRTLWITYLDLPVERGRSTLEVDGRIRRNIFYRFFGLGPDSVEANQSSYTRTVAALTARWGWNFPAHLNAGARGTLQGDHLLRNPIFGLPATQDLFPTAPGISGAGFASVEASLRFDTRPAAEYSDSGFTSELRLGHDHPLTAFDPFWQLAWQTRGLLRENSFLQSAARLYWVRELGGGGEIPFYYQAVLGGDSLLRGFPDDRFIDTSAWEAEVEQRFRLLETHIFGVTTDWRFDPFVAAGQVYDRFADIVSRVHFSVGMGLRAWVKPNILGRVDVAYAGEGVNAYVVLGYPY
ncbi:MAG TPA: BamA/TamA family outer membrane protein [Polyangia bacterium]|jgi:hypothetical protein